jgi:hypothetical protein
MITLDNGTEIHANSGGVERLHELSTHYAKVARAARLLCGGRNTTTAKLADEASEKLSDAGFDMEYGDPDSSALNFVTCYTDIRQTRVRK